MIDPDPVLFTIFLIFTGAAALATGALYARQALLVSYILLGFLFGPWGFALVTDARVITEIAHIGVIFLLFLLGLNLHPQKLIALLRQTTFVTAVSSGAFALSAAVGRLAVRPQSNRVYRAGCGAYVLEHHPRTEIAAHHGVTSPTHG